MNEPTETTAAMPPTRQRPWAWWLVAAVVLVVVLVQYQNPHFLVSMADQLWGCF